MLALSRAGPQGPGGPGDPGEVGQSPKGGGPDALWRREAAMAQKEEEWLADAGELLRRVAPPGRRRGGRAPGAALPAPDWMSLGERSGCPSTGSDLGGNGSDCGNSADFSSSMSDGSLRRRLQSVRFLAWQQAQLRDDLARRESEIAAARQEVRNAHAYKREEEDKLATRASILLDAEGQLLKMEGRRVREVQDRWRELDERANAVDTSARAAYTTALHYEQHGHTLAEAQNILAVAERQAEQLNMQVGVLKDQRQEVEAREAALYCMESAWGCVAQQWCVAAVGDRSCTNAEAEDYVAAIREAVTECIVEELLKDDPRLWRDHGHVWSVVHSSLGGPQLASMSGQDLESPRDQQINGDEVEHASAASTGLDEGANSIVPADADTSSDGDDGDGSSVLLPSKSRLVGLDVLGSASSLSLALASDTFVSFVVSPQRRSLTPPVRSFRRSGVRAEAPALIPPPTALGSSVELTGLLPPTPQTPPRRSEKFRRAQSTSPQFLRAPHSEPLATVADGTPLWPVERLTSYTSSRMLSGECSPLRRSVTTVLASNGLALSGPLVVREVTGPGGSSMLVSGGGSGGASVTAAAAAAPVARPPLSAAPQLLSGSLSLGGVASSGGSLALHPRGSFLASSTSEGACASASASSGVAARGSAAAATGGQVRVFPRHAPLPRAAQRAADHSRDRIGAPQAARPPYAAPPPQTPPGQHASAPLPPGPLLPGQALQPGQAAATQAAPPGSFSSASSGSSVLVAVPSGRATTAATAAHGLRGRPAVAAGAAHGTGSSGAPPLAPIVRLVQHHAGLSAPPMLAGAQQLGLRGVT